MFDDFILINAKYDLKLALFSIFHFKQNNDQIEQSNQTITCVYIHTLCLYCPDGACVILHKAASYNFDAKLEPLGS